MDRLICLDTSAICYFLLYKYELELTETNPKLEELLIRIKAELSFINSRVWLSNRHPWKVLWLLDSKPYWRSLYEPEYKTNRPQREITKYLDICVDFIKETFFWFGQDSFEADDLAGSIVRENPNDEILLVTVDSDWLGLTKPNVTIINPTFEPKVRNLAEAYLWLVTHHKKAIIYVKQRFKIPSFTDFKPPQVWDFKQIEGDKIDNLPPGSHIGLISLLNPLITPSPFDMTVMSSAPLYRYDKDLIGKFANQGVFPLDPIIYESKWQQ